MFCKDLDTLSTELHKLSEGIAIVLAAEKDFDYNEFQIAIKATSIPIVGAFFPGVIAESELHYTGFIIQYINSPFELQVFDLNSKDPKFLKGTISTGTGLILMDGLANGNQAFLNSVFYEYGSEFRFVGSGAGSLDLIQKPCVFDKDGIYTDKALIILTPMEVAIGLQHGYDRIAGPFVATRTEGSKIIELNWENAFDVYADSVNEDSFKTLTKKDFFDLSKGYPLGLSRKGHEDIVRDPISVDEFGVLHCIDDVPENAPLYVLKGENDKLIEAAGSSCQEALDNLKGTPVNCLLIDCVTRVLYLGDEFTKEIATATRKVHSKYSDVLVEGVLSMGEISTFKDGRLEIYNKTFLTSMLYV